MIFALIYMLGIPMMFWFLTEVGRGDGGKFKTPIPVRAGISLIWPLLTLAAFWFIAKYRWKHRRKIR